MKISTLVILATLPTTSALSSYLNQLVSNSATVTGSGLSGYLDALPPTPAPALSGGGVGSYLDTVSSEAPPVPIVAPSPVPVPAAAPVPVAPQTSAPVATDSAPAVGDYLGTLAGANALSGSGLPGHLDTLGFGTASLSGAGVAGHLDTLVVNAGTSGAGLASYTDALASNSALAGSSLPTSSTSSTSGSFFENVYDMVVQLDENAPGVSIEKGNDSVSFAASADAYTMSFIKKGN